MAMTMYTIAGKALNEEEFARAAQVSLGKPLDRPVIKTVFRIFDIDGKYVRRERRKFNAFKKSWKKKKKEKKKK